MAGSPVIEGAAGIGRFIRETMGDIGNVDQLKGNESNAV
jgi:hypothetical protein